MKTALSVVPLVLFGVMVGCEGQSSEVGSVNNTQTQSSVPPTNLPIGAGCMPTVDEWAPLFSGYQVTEVNVDDHVSQCASGICLVNHYQGRMTCPYGQPDPAVDPSPDSPRCTTPDGDLVTVAVPPQLVDRRPEDVATCSCRCDGPAGTGDNFCTCPDGFECVPMLADIGLGQEWLAGSYCIKAGTAYDGNKQYSACDWQLQNCGPG